MFSLIEIKYQRREIIIQARKSPYFRSMLNFPWPKEVGEACEYQITEATWVWDDLEDNFEVKLITEPTDVLLRVLPDYGLVINAMTKQVIGRY